MDAEFTSDNVDIVALVELILEENRDSDRINDMLIAQSYFLVKNEEIYNKEDSQSVNLSNQKLASALYRLSVEQKVNYAFNSDIIFSFTDNSDKAEQDENPLFTLYQDEFSKFMSFDNKNIIVNMATDCINKGIAWAFINLDEDGNLILQDFEPETIYPLWSNRQHNDLNGLVRDYQVKEFVEGEFQTVNKIDYFDKNEHFRLIDDGGVEIDTSQDTYHFINNNRGDTWGRVPFVFLKSNQDELPLLNVIKSYLDAYDLLTSKTIDTLVDDIDSILVLQGVTTDVKKLEEVRKMIKDFRVVSLPMGNEASYLGVKSDISSIQMQRESLYKNIMQYSSTVDTNDVKGGTNNSGVALKSMYQNIDIYTNGLERQLKITFSNIKYFFDKYLSLKNLGTEEQFKEFTINLQLDRDMLINETELIDNTARLQTLVSQQTLDEYNPLVYSHDQEEKRRQDDALKHDEEEAKYSYNFDNVDKQDDEKRADLSE